MKYLPKKKNKLVTAIEKLDWAEVRNICETDPHLINTHDEDRWTPVMRAVDWHDAPEDIMVMLVDKATDENIEYERKVGDTVVSGLALQGYPVALRHALERTASTQVNKEDKFGRTPLQLSLKASCSYQRQIDTALCLMEYGALLSIKDQNGFGPFEWYAANECSKYADSTREANKKELVKLLEELSVPSVILARGRAAVKAYTEELHHGKVTIVQSRFMFLGKEGSGKTSCVNSMLGKPFNKNEQSTDGIVRTFFQAKGNQWEEQTDIDECERTKQIHEYSVVENLAKRLKNPVTTREPTRTQEPTLESEMTTEIKTVSVSEIKEKRTVSQNIYPTKSTNQPTAIKTTKIPDGIHKKLVDKLSDQNTVHTGPVDATSIWDHAGQLTYYITHRLFLTGKSSYGVVFSLVDDLDALVQPRDCHVGLYHMTNMEMTIFWIRSIIEYAVLPHSAGIEVVNGITLPTISLIATHKDQLTGSNEEINEQIDRIYDRIFDALKGTVFEKHIDHERYAVDNTVEADEGIEKLKQNVRNFMKSAAKPIPTSWVDFQRNVHEIGKTHVRMSLEKITEMAINCGISKENVIHVINYLNDIGVVLYWPTNRTLKHVVITNVHMVIGVFTSVIIELKQVDFNKQPVMMKSWHLLNDKGILCESLLRHLWKQQLEEDKSNFEVYIELMKLFGLLFIKLKGQEDSQQTFIVPTRMKRVNEGLKVNRDEEHIISIYVTPTDFLPDAIYNLLVVAFVNLMKVKGRTINDGSLFKNRSDFELDDEHTVSLGSVKINNRHALKLEIAHTIEVDESGKQVGPLSEPQSSFCMEVLNYLTHHLKSVYVTTEGIGYNLSVLCTVCQPTEQKFHLHNLQECLLTNNIRCGDVSMDTSNFKRLFTIELEPEFIEETKNFQVIQSLIIDLGTKKIKEFFLTTTQQTEWSVDAYLKNIEVQMQPKVLDIFPTSNTDVNTFDMTTLMKLIRHHCGFSYPDSVWENPNRMDNKQLASLIKIQQYKDNNLDQNTSCRIPTKEFLHEWTKVKNFFSDVDYSDLETIRSRKGLDKADLDEIQNFQAIMTLVVDIGGEAMRNYFLRVSRRQKKHVGQFLLNEKESFKREQLTDYQKSVMFSLNADIDSFDISIMYKIIRNCSPKLSFWRNPDEMDILSNFLRLHQYRNKLTHSCNARMMNDEFETDWRKLTSLLLGVGASTETINKYKQVRFIK